MDLWLLTKSELEFGKKNNNNKKKKQAYEERKQERLDPKRM